MITKAILNKFIPRLFQFVSILLFCLLSFSSFAATVSLGQMYVTATNPFFAEVPVCNIGANENRFKVQIATNEDLIDRSNQPFTDSLYTALDIRNASEGLISISGQKASPDDLSLIISLIDDQGVIVDSNIYSNLQEKQELPSDFGCPPIPATRKQETPAEFIIDVVNGDTWRNLAKVINAAWYDQAFSIERVMVGLYKRNTDHKTMRPNIVHPIPQRLIIPTKDFIKTIDIAMASKSNLLDFSGVLKVSKDAPVHSKEMLLLQKELKLLKQQIDNLSNQLIDSKKLAEMSRDEVTKLKQNLLETRKRISDLEQINEELEKRTIFDMIKVSILTYPFLWAILGILLFFIVIWIMLSIVKKQQTQEIRRLQKKKSMTLDTINNKPTPSVKKKVTKAQTPQRTTQEKKDRTVTTNLTTPATFSLNKAKPANIVPVVDEETDNRKTTGNSALTETKEDDSIDEARSLLDLAVAYLSMGDKAEAKQTLMKAIELGSPEIRREAQEHLANLD